MAMRCSGNSSVRGGGEGGGESLSGSLTSCKARGVSTNHLHVQLVDCTVQFVYCTDNTSLRLKLLLLFPAMHGD